MKKAPAIDVLMACMQVSGVEENDLRAGVKLAEKEKFFNFTEGRMLTLDY